MPNIIHIEVALCDVPKANIVHPIASEPYYQWNKEEDDWSRQDDT
jgi:hypothetical protein